MNKTIVSIFAVLAFVLMAPSIHAASVTTAGVSNIAQTSATVSGMYSLGTSSADVYFEYADNSGFYGSKNTTHSVYTSSASISANLTGLNPNTTYYYRLIAEGSIYESGGTMYFKTLSSGIDLPVSTVTAGAKDITVNSATITGMVSNVPTSVYFEYGKTTSLGSTVYAISTVTGNSISATANLSNLEANTTYYYRIGALNSSGQSNGSILYFTTLKNGGSTGSCAITSFASNVYSIYSGSSVTLSWAATGCTYVNFGQAGGSTFPMSGSATVSPTTTSTYTLYAYGTNNNDTKSVTITVVNNGGGNPPCTYNCNPPCTYNCNTCSYNCGHAYTNDCSWYNCWMNNFQQDNFQQPCTWRGTCAPIYYNTMSYNNQNVNAYSQNGSTTSNGYNNPVNNSTNSNSNSTNTKSGVYNIYENSKSLLGNSASASDVSNVNSQNSNIDSSNLAAGAGFSLVSFLPSTLVGWLLFIIFVLFIIFIARKLTAKKNNNAHGHAH